MAMQSHGNGPCHWYGLVVVFRLWRAQWEILPNGAGIGVEANAEDTFDVKWTLLEYPAHSILLFPKCLSTMTHASFFIVVLISGKQMT